MSSTESARDVSDFVLALTDTLGPEFDVAGLLYDLVLACVQLLDIDAAGVLLLDERGHPIPVAATDNAAGHLDQMQARTELGPCPESVRGGQTVVCADLEQDGDRWPDFARTARERGFRAVHALPLSLRNQTVGGINLLRRASGTLSEADRRTGTLLATASATGLLHRRAVHELDTVNGQLRGALASRVVIEQAKGFLVARHGLTLDVAFALLRGHARSRRQRLTHVAQGVLDGSIDLS
ncbi:GAF and ANTAR domain-containing protein [Actinomycetospora sp. CA-101289]|uniref:GAF and ANTAR domain-containing protein n=1 Tax=Actinomycetospora sp. CA-101289 TaxID=3239893 RepID=UPI003D99CC00